MGRFRIPNIGMRKIKSVLALFLSFLLWQVARLLYPALDIHPFYSYVYAVVEMRGNAEETTEFGKRRMKSTLIGIVIGLLFLPLCNSGGFNTDNRFLSVSADIFVIAAGVLVTLCVSDFLKCKNYCAMAAVVFLFCVVRNERSLENTYISALLRVAQTLIGVLSAWVVNTFICRYPKKTTDNKEKMP